MMNTLANHGYLPHNGKNIDQATTIHALDKALNMPAHFAVFLHEAAVTTNPDGPWSNTFDLDHLGIHGILEHDASLSRQDAYFGDAVSFNASVFAETTSYWPGDSVDVPQAAAARLGRVRTSQRTNPEYDMSTVGRYFGIGEVAVFILTLGDPTTWKVPRKTVEYLFGEWIRLRFVLCCFFSSACELTLYASVENERLPTEVGWSRPVNELAVSDMYSVISEIIDLSVNVSGAKRALMGDDLHGLAARKAMASSFDLDF